MLSDRVYRGKFVLAFDGDLWTKNGGDHKTDTFYRKAKVLKIYKERGRVLADIEFEHSKRISPGHFVDCFKNYFEKSTK